MARPRVLLVEDDASLRRFVSMALEDLDIELVVCVSVAAALEHLRQGPFCLVLTDLMLPGESGFDLLARLRQEPALKGPARAVVLSAGLTPAVRQQLADADVWRLLSKPVSVGALLACVEDAIADFRAGERPDAPAGGPADQPVPGLAGDLSADADRAHAMREYFGGSQVLFDAYRLTCIGQFGHDVQAGDAALAAGDAHALRRLAHSLKSVLLMLGYPRLSALARQLEESSQAGLGGPALAQWGALRSALTRLQQPA